MSYVCFPGVPLLPRSIVCWITPSRVLFYGVE
uniref:Uncharacterized protein n=1 Tax=Rhizophora mucronata TaxID=61149 RepID=A0A2P2IN82_RHIMU